MKLDMKVKIIERTLEVEASDIIAFAKRDSLWPKNGTPVEWWWDDEAECFKIRVHIPEPDGEADFA